MTLIEHAKIFDKILFSLIRCQAYWKHQVRFIQNPRPFSAQKYMSLQSSYMKVAVGKSGIFSRYLIHKKAKNACASGRRNATNCRELVGGSLKN
jgi:hypothetical protein